MSFKTKISEKSKLVYFLSQPHQPFFLLGMSNALIFMLFFYLSYKGILHSQINSIFFHAYSMIFSVFTQFFLGFLLTTFPKFSQTEPIEKRTYLTVFAFGVSASVSLLLSPFFKWAYLLSFILVVFEQSVALSVFYKIYKKTSAERYDQYWIIVSFGIGIFSNLSFLLSFIALDQRAAFIYLKTAVNFGIYLYLIFLALTVASRMVPFFSHRIVKKNEKFLPFIFILFLTRSFLAEIYPKALFLPDILAAFLIAKEIKRWQLPFPNKEPLLWILHLSVFWIPAALFVVAATDFFENFFKIYLFNLSLHVLVLGFLTTVLIGFATRVTIGHSGNVLKADKTTVYIFYFTQVVLLFRILFSVGGYFGKISPFFDISALLWTVLFSWWLIKYFKVLSFGEKMEN